MRTTILVMFALSSFAYFAAWALEGKHRRELLLCLMWATTLIIMGKADLT